MKTNLLIFTLRFIFFNVLIVIISIKAVITLNYFYCKGIFLIIFVSCCSKDLRWLAHQISPKLYQYYPLNGLDSSSSLPVSFQRCWEVSSAPTTFSITVTYMLIWKKNSALWEGAVLSPFFSLSFVVCWNGNIP